MAFFWVVVIRGGRKPFVVLSACKIADACAAAEPPTFNAAFVVIPPVLLASRVVNDDVPRILNLRRFVDSNSKAIVPLFAALETNGVDVSFEENELEPSSLIIKVV